jgi:hypothetical protein
MGRPKGSKDKRKRVTKRITTAREENAIIKDYNAGLLTNKQICEKHQISKSALNNVRYRHNIPSKNIDNILGKAVAHEDLKDRCGIYAITNKFSSEGTARKAYIGSSVNIYKRVQNHLCKLRKGSHYNKSLQESWSENNYCLFVIEECTEEELLDREKSVMEKINPGALHNTWNGTDPPEERYRDKIRQKIIKNVVITDNGCWESTKNIKRGYCEISYRTEDRHGRADKIKFVKAHRFMYYDATGDWAQLVRHMCDNKACCNPDHLQAGSHRQNLLDRFVESDKEFEKVWIELGGDPVKITKRLGYKPNCKTVSGAVSASVYEREKKLGLRNRFPELIKKRQRTGNKYGTYGPE